MAKDFRPKSARGDNERGLARSKEKKKQTKIAESKDDQSSSDEDDNNALLDSIRAMGGDEGDLDLIRKSKGKSKASNEDNGAEDPALNNEVLSFMKGLDFKGAGVTAPSMTVNKAGSTDVNGKKSGASASEKREKLSTKIGADVSSVAIEKVKSSKGKALAKVEPPRRELKEVKEVKKVHSNGISKEERSKGSTSAADTAAIHSRNKDGFLVEPTSRWSEIQLAALQCPSASSITADEVAALQDRGSALLKREKELYTTLNRSGKGLGPGMLSSSDAKFISELLGPGARGGTLSDRVAALTMLAQSSPIHNLDAIESLLQMAGKKGREESGRATRALADWFASGGGLSQRKLRYIRDHPSTNQLVYLLLRTKSTDTDVQSLADAHLLLATFEDKLKRSYFSFIQILETQTHDTLPFVRKQAVTQIYLLLKEKSEQEQNLLRLLVNKLGDIDRAVASKASSSLLNILTAHPNMKVVISKEISNLVMKPSGGSDGDAKPKFNSHARYYGMLTLNQIMFTMVDESIANGLVNLYFDLFETLLNEMGAKSGGKEEQAEEGGGIEKTKDAPKKIKQRWRDGKSKGKNGKGKVPVQDESKVIQDADAKIMAAVLTGVRRALPFAKIDASVLDKHMSTLFRITHSSTFNISIQALQLIYQVTLTDSSTRSNAAISTVNVEDRFYRALYASMLDPRLATTSKQAMYLNLLYKAIKSDGDSRRVKAFIKRFVQTFDHAEPPWICGGLYLLGELMTALPGLKTLMEEPEDEGDEHYVDAVEASDEEGIIDNNTHIEAKKASLTAHTQLYDALKREPQYAKAENSCLWEVIPLLFHFHPSVSLHARQLLSGERITTTADLTLNTLSHFLDRFVYRNPKKSIASSKGVSIMQPALNVNDGKIGLESGVVKLKGIGIRKDEFVNDEGFWKKKVQDVPVDQLFFHKYFSQKLKRNGVVDKAEEESKDDDSGASTEGESEEGEDSEDSENEKEILKAIKRTMPRLAGDDELLNESDVDEDDDEMMAMMAEEGDSENAEGSEASDDDSDGIPFDEDEDDLVSVDFHEEEDKASKSGTKRGLEDVDEDSDENDVPKEKSKSQLRREEKRRRKALPTFASAEDYAHLLGGSEEEEAGDDEE